MSKEQNKNYGKSIRAKLLNVAKKENTFYQTILTRYFQERLLYRMSQTRYRSNFYLKGGALMYAYERFAARPTLDIDFLGNNISNEGTSIIAAFKEICSVPFEEDGVVFDVEHITAQNITEFKDYHGIRLSIPVMMDSISQVLTMDIGFGDVVTPSPVNLDFPILLEHLPCANILAYSLETVIAEKMHAIIDLADQSSRMKDYYDIYYLANKFDFDGATLTKALKKTFENRGHAFTIEQFEQVMGFAENDAMQKKWKAFTRKIDTKTDDYSIVLKTIRAFLTKPFTAEIDNIGFSGRWSANQNEWIIGGSYNG